MNNSSNSSLGEPSVNQSTIPKEIPELVPIAVLIVLTNGLVFLLFCKMKTLRTPANYFLLSLAISDVMTGLINIPLLLSIRLLHDRNHAMYLVCASEVFHNLISFSVAYHITAITVEKYLAVVNPFGRFLMTKKTVVKILSAVWLWSALLGTIPASWLFSAWNSDPLSLYLQAGHNILCLVIVFVIPYMFILYAYSIMFKAVSSKHRFKNKTNPRAFKRANNEKKCLIILLTMATTFAICWLPWFTLRLLFSIYYIEWIDTIYMAQASQIFVIIRYLSSAINPLLYTFFKQDFWSAFKVVVLKKQPRRPSTIPSIRPSMRLTTRRSGGSEQHDELLVSETMAK